MEISQEGTNMLEVQGGKTTGMKILSKKYCENLGTPCEVILLSENSGNCCSLFNAGNFWKFRLFSFWLNGKQPSVTVQRGELEQACIGTFKGRNETNI